MDKEAPLEPMVFTLDIVTADWDGSNDSCECDDWVQLDNRD